MLSLFADTGHSTEFVVSIAGGSAVGFDDFSRKVALSALRLKRVGVGPGDVVLLQAGQRTEILVLFWATMNIGAVFAPLDDTWPDYLIEIAAGSLRPKLVVCTQTRAATYQRLFPSSAQLVLSEPGGGTGELDAWMGEDDAMPPPPAPVGGTAPAAYLFTSGSTGTPKAVVLSRDALAHGAKVTLAAFGWVAGERLVNLPEPHTMSGLRNGLVAAVYGGMHLDLFGPAERENIFALLDAIQQSKPARLVAGPALVRQIAVLGDRVDYESLASIKAIYSTGAPLNPASAEQFHSRFGAPVVNYYGLTETGGICVSQPLADWRPGDRSLGVAVGAELRVRTELGTASAFGEGELQVRSPQLMSGYLDDPERTAARFTEGWIRTGDLARIDTDGRVHLVGRADNFIKTPSTDRVAPEEIEFVLEEHPAVAEAGVLAAQSGHGVERIAALIVLREPAGPGVDELELAEFVGSRLGAARTPSLVRFVPRLPRQSTGKIIRSELQGLLDEFV